MLEKMESAAVIVGRVGDDDETPSTSSNSQTRKSKRLVHGDKEKHKPIINIFNGLQMETGEVDVKPILFQIGTFVAFLT